MADSKQLQYLLRLLDDDSPDVRQAVATELLDFGTSLDSALQEEQLILTDEQSRVIRSLLGTHQRQSLIDAWPSWFHIQDDKRKLETGLALIAEFQNGPDYPKSLSRMLDQLTIDFSEHSPRTDVRGLARYLFHIRGLQGIREGDFYDPRNSNLIHVLEHRRGNPISLCCIFLLVGHRLDFDIEGCNFPGHFLALTKSANKVVLVDCFNGGRFIYQKDLAGIKANISMDDIVRLECDAQAIIERVLHNLIAAYGSADNEENRQLMQHLLSLTQPSIDDAEEGMP